MTHEEQIVARAREIASQETGGEAPEAVIAVLARMVAATSQGVTAGFLRLPPARPVKEIEIDQHRPL